MENAGRTLYKGIPVQCWAPLAAGKDLDNPILASLAKKYKKSVVQIILRWDIQSGLLTVTRSTKVEHMKENFNIFNFELSAVDMSIINGININQGTYEKTTPIIFHGEQNILIAINYSKSNQSS
ncbi:MAG: aldo/keto reductase [Bacteroidia bacterium]|nr:aldo/keto reductase [Bacteroidia bacterium]MCZ2276339.1 aldo/keto reductase [Bacteroidia bacterium]